MKPSRYHVLVALALALWAGYAVARSTGPPASRTGAAALGGIAAEPSCTGCHSGNALNTNGSVSLLGVPSLYVGGKTYHLTVHLASTQQNSVTGRTWGFELTAVDSISGQGAGTFVVTNATQTAVISGTSAYSTRRYAEQIIGGIHTGAASPVEWQVDWTAPASGGPVIKFFVAGLAGDGGATSGDWVYTGSATATDTTTAAIPRTWGSVKASYRQ